MEPGRDVSSVEVFGFLGWITTSVAYILFILWAFVPDEVLHRHGITYYPSRYWAMAIPTWLCVTVLFLYLAYACMNKILEKNLVAEMKSNTPGTQKGEQERVRLFNETSGEAVLPLAVLPREVVKLVLEHDVSPLEAEKIYWDQSVTKKR